MRPLVPSDNIPQPNPTPAFTPRPKQDPPAMSAMFVALTVVCVLGASAVMTTAGRDGGLDSWTKAASNVLGSVGLGVAAASLEPAPDAGRTEAAALEREITTSNANVDFLGSIVRDNAASTNKAFARVYHEITSLKGEVSALREKSEPSWASSRVDDLRDKVGTLRANMNLLQSSLDDISVAQDRDADRLNKRLAKIEDVISIRGDVTASIPHQTFPPLPRKRAARTALWSAEENTNGTYTVRGPTGTFEVTVGSFVPGLGRIEAVKHQGGKLRLVTGKDRTPPPAAE